MGSSDSSSTVGRSTSDTKPKPSGLPSEAQPNVQMTTWQGAADPAFSDEWEHLCDRVLAPPFLRPGWIETWRAAFAPDASPAIVTVRRGERLAALLPLLQSRRGFRSPTNSESPLFGPVAGDAHSEEAVVSWLASLKPSRIQLHVLDQDHADGAISLLQKAGSVCLVTPSLRSPFVDLSDGFPRYEEQLSRKVRTEIRRRRRRLEELGGLRLEVLDGSRDLTSLLEEGFRVEGGGWKGSHATSITAHPMVQRFYEDIARWAAGRDSLRLAFLRLDDAPIAFDLCLEDGGVHYLLKTGYDEDFRKFGPGMLLRYLMIQRAFNEGLSSYEFLGTVEGANNAWKREWTNSFRRRVDVEVFAPTLRGRIEWAARVGGRAARRRGLDAARRLLSDAARHRVKSILGHWRTRR